MLVLKKNAITFLGFYIKNSSFYYKTTVLDNYKTDIYWNKISRKKR